MPRGRPIRDPSLRNLELYHELVCEGRLQAVVAARFRVTQSRVAQISLQIRDWIDRLLPTTAKARLPLANGFSLAGQSLHLAIALRRKYLTDAYGEFLAHFGGPAGAAAYGQLLAAQDAALLPRELADRLPPRYLVQTAARLARELDGLTRLAQRGPFFRLPEPASIPPPWLRCRPPPRLLSPRLLPLLKH